MYRDKERYGQDPTRVVRSSPVTFRKPLSWKAPAYVFTCSWSDFFIEDADAWRDEAWDIIRKTPHLTYQILTKRPENIPDRLPKGWGEGWPNVWLGVSTENQEYAEKRIPLLLAVPANTRFLSCEPLLGPLDLTKWLCGGFPPSWGYPNELHWIIAGGESGPHARVMLPEWPRSLRDQCLRSGVAFFFKQWGGLTPKSGGRLLDGREWNEMPAARG